MNVIVTGAAGFIGGFLANYCAEAGCSVLGIDINEPSDVASGTVFERCDVRDSEKLSPLIRSASPDCIFHLAAQSYPTVSLEKPGETMDVNACGTIHLFESVRRLGTIPKVVVACSSAEYGPVAAADLPVREDHPLRPLHPYGVSKVAQDLLAAQYFYNYSIPCVRIRIFNTTGPGKIGDVCSDLTKRAAEMQLGLRPRQLPVGNLTSRRAILDVRDLVSALWLSVERCGSGDVYNVCGRQIYSVQELIESIKQLIGIGFEIEQNGTLMRGCDEPVIAGDTSKFQSRTGWSQTIHLMNTLREMLSWWRTQLSSTRPDAITNSDPLSPARVFGR